MKRICIFLIIFLQTLAQIIPISSISLPNNQYSVHQTGENVFSTLHLDNNNNIQYSGLYQVTCVGDNCIVDMNIFDITNKFFTGNDTQQRISSTNAVDSLYNAFIHFNSHYLIRYSQSYMQQQVILNQTTSQSFIILDAFFQSNSTEMIYVVCQQISNLKFYLRYYNRTLLINQTQIVIQNNNDQFVESKQGGDYIYILFGFQVYVATENALMTKKMCFEYSNYLDPNLTNKVGIDVYQKHFVFFINKNIFIYRLNCYEQFQSVSYISARNVIQDVQIHLPYIVYIMSKILYQYDIDVRFSFFTLLIAETDQSFIIFKNQALITLNNYQSEIFDNLNIYKITSNISYLLGSSCATGYYEWIDSNNITYCVKNMSYLYPVLICAPTTPIVQNITNLTNLTNATIIFNNNVNKDQNQQFIDSTLTVMGKIFAFSNLNFVSNSAKLIFMLIDDIWYYRFHRTNYPQNYQNFLQKTDILYEFRFNPWFVKKIQAINNIQVCKEEQQIYSQLISQNENNPDGIYFLNNASQIYINNWIVNFVFFLFSKGVCFLLMLLRNYSHKFENIFKWMANNTKVWNLLTMIIEGNLIILTFDCCLQLLILSELNFLSKFNNIFCIILLFVIFLYATAFYPLIYSFEHKHSSQNLLKFSYHEYRSYFFESYCYMLRIVIRGFIQALLLQSYYFQIVALTVSDALCICLIVFFRKQFWHQLTFVLMLLYNVLFLFLDFIFTLKHKFDSSLFITKQSAYQFIVLFILWLIIGIFVMMIFSNVGITIYQLCTKNKKQNSQVFQKNQRETKMQPVLNETNQVSNMENNQVIESVKNSQVNSVQQSLMNSQKNNCNLRITEQIGEAYVPVEKIFETQKSIKKIKKQKPQTKQKKLSIKLENISYVQNLYTSQNVKNAIKSTKLNMIY